VQLEHFAQAASVYEAALALDGNNGAVWNNLGEVHMQRHDYVSAEGAFRRAAQLLPDNHEPGNNLGNALDAQGAGRRLEAISAYRDALKLAPDGAARGAIYANLGETLRRSRDFSRAAAVLDSSLHLAPTAMACDYRGRVAYDMGDMAAAQAFWQRAVGLDATRGTAWSGLGEVWLAAGDLEGAEQALRQAVSSGGGTRAWLSLARCLEARASIPAALEAYEQLIRFGQAGDPRVAAAQQRLLELAQAQ
ncbi:MAG: tetratricopeptide repeat protein, partial [bacterium]|nr:tetratricopeptide repeat protein [bacterium]